MASHEIPHLPPDFLDGPSPDTITVHHIDFEGTPVPEYKDDYAVILDNVLSRGECRALIAGIESHCNGQWTRATVNTYGKGKALYSDVRSCGRIIWDSDELSRRLWERVKPHLPEIESLSNWPDVTGMGPTTRGELWKATRLNERMRFLKYTSGEFFRPHNDMTYETPDKKERSYFTLHLYLNDSESGEEEPLSGGATTFHSWDMEGRYDVEPKAGSVLVFQQRNLKHSGDDVKQGIKYSVRTDIMYTKDPDVKVDAVDVSEGRRDKVKAKWSWIGKQ